MERKFKRNDEERTIVIIKTVYGVIAEFYENGELVLETISMQLVNNIIEEWINNGWKELK